MFRGNILYLFVIPINTQEAGIVGLHKCKYSYKQTNKLFIPLRLSCIVSILDWLRDSYLNLIT